MYGECARTSPMSGKKDTRKSLKSDYRAVFGKNCPGKFVRGTKRGAQNENTSRTKKGKKKPAAAKTAPQVAPESNGTEGAAATMAKSVERKRFTTQDGSQFTAGTSVALRV